MVPNQSTRLGFTPSGELLVTLQRSDALGHELLALYRRASDGSLSWYDDGLWASEIFGFGTGDGTLFAATNVGVYQLTK